MEWIIVAQWSIAAIDRFVVLQLLLRHTAAAPFPQRSPFHTTFAHRTDLADAWTDHGERHCTLQQTLHLRSHNSIIHTTALYLTLTTITLLTRRFSTLPTTLQSPTMS